MKNTLTLSCLKLFTTTGQPIKYTRKVIEAINERIQTDTFGYLVYWNGHEIYYDLPKMLGKFTNKYKLRAYVPGGKACWVTTMDPIETPYGMDLNFAFRFNNYQQTKNIY